MTSETPADKKIPPVENPTVPLVLSLVSCFLFCPTDYCGGISSWAYEYFGGIQKPMRIYNERRAYVL